jgi:hypothetical protein
MPDQPVLYEARGSMATRIIGAAGDTIIPAINVD